MTPEDRQLFAHLALALGRYLPDAQRDARAGGYELPPQLLPIAEFLTSCARTRQETTPLDAPPAAADARSMTESPLLLEKAEAAALLRVSVRQLERLIAADKLQSVRVGSGAVRVRRADLDAYVAGLAPSSFRDELETKDGAA